MLVDVDDTVRATNAVIATISSPDSVPVIAATRREAVTQDGVQAPVPRSVQQTRELFDRTVSAAPR